MRSLFLFLLVLFFSAPCLAKEVSPLRKFVWGATPEDIRKYETATFYKREGDSDFYVETAEDFYRTIRYDFRDGKLWRGEYSYDRLVIPHTQKVLERAADFRIAMEDIYGAPTREEMIWTDERRRNSQQRIGAAIRDGHLKIQTVWEIPDSKIVMEVLNNGAVYQLGYVAESVEKAKADESTNILNLPLDTQKQPRP